MLSRFTLPMRRLVSPLVKSNTLSLTRGLTPFVARSSIRLFSTKKNAAIPVPQMKSQLAALASQDIQSLKETPTDANEFIEANKVDVAGPNFEGVLTCAWEANGHKVTATFNKDFDDDEVDGEDENGEEHEEANEDEDEEHESDADKMSAHSFDVTISPMSDAEFVWKLNCQADPDGQLLVQEVASTPFLNETPIYFHDLSDDTQHKIFSLLDTMKVNDSLATFVQSYSRDVRLTEHCNKLQAFAYWLKDEKKMAMELAPPEEDEETKEKIRNLEQKLNELKKKM